MRAQVKDISINDYLGSTAEQPLNSYNTWMVIDAEIGPEGEPGAEVFRFYVCTPTALAQMTQDGEYRFGRHLLIVKEFDWDLTVLAINKLVSSFDEPDWHALGTKIAKYGAWEFEDYTD